MVLGVGWKWMACEHNQRKRFSVEFIAFGVTKLIGDATLGVGGAKGVTCKTNKEQPISDLDK